MSLVGKFFLALLLTTNSFAAVTALDQQIEFWEKRIARDSDDFISPTKLGELLLQKARHAGDFAANAEAEKNLRLALKRNPEYHAAIVLLAQACVAQHKFSEALTLAEKAVKLSGDDVFSIAVLGDACLELGNIARAEAAYKKIVQLKPALATHSRMANLQWIKGDVAAALSNYADALQAGERDATAPENLVWCHLQKGELHFRTGDFEKARQEYDAASKILPDNYSVLEHRAELFAANGQYKDAITLYQKAIAQAPRPELYQALGDVYQFAGKAAEAKPWHDKALAGYLEAATGENVHYNHHLASFYSDIQLKPEEALKWARKDLQLRQNVFAYDALAWALYQNDRWAEALKAIDKTLAFGTKDAHLLFHAGMIHLGAGKAAEGKKFLQQALAINPRYHSFHAHR